MSSISVSPWQNCDYCNSSFMGEQYVIHFSSCNHFWHVRCIKIFGYDEQSILRADTMCFKCKKLDEIQKMKDTVERLEKIPEVLETDVWLTRPKRKISVD